MRKFRGLENIHAVIDRHVAEWRKEQGEPVEDIKEFSIEENVRKRLAANNDSGTGRFSADRFLGAKPKKEKAGEPEVEIKSIIKHQDGKPHSWLYNEVVKAINDASDGKNTKVVAIFIPVVQNGKEFEDLPVDSSVTLPPVDEEAVKIEGLVDVSEPEEAHNEDDFNLLPEGQAEPDAELADAFQTMEEKLDETLQEQPAPEPVTEETAEDLPEEEPVVGVEEYDDEEPESVPDEVPGEAMKFTEIVDEDESDEDESGKLEDVEIPEVEDESSEPELVPLPEDFDADDEVFDDSEFVSPLAELDKEDGEEIIKLEDENEDEEKITL